MSILTQKPVLKTEEGYIYHDLVHSHSLSSSLKALVLGALGLRLGLRRSKDGGNFSA